MCEKAVADTANRQRDVRSSGADLHNIIGASPGRIGPGEGLRVGANKRGGDENDDRCMPEQ